MSEFGITYDNPLVKAMEMIENVGGKVIWGNKARGEQASREAEQQGSRGAGQQDSRGAGKQDSREEGQEDSRGAGQQESREEGQEDSRGAGQQDNRGVGQQGSRTARLVDSEGIVSEGGLPVLRVLGEFIVAENGATWVELGPDEDRSSIFLAEHLIVEVPEDQVVHNMHEAYKRIEGRDYSYGTFISGPSKTADIEQSLVIGAQGPRRLTVFFGDAK